MNHNPDLKPGYFVSSQQRRLSLEENGSRRSSSNDYSNYDSGDIDAATYHPTEDDCNGNRSAQAMNMDEGDDAGFAAIEMVRPQSPSMDDPNTHSEDVSVDESGADGLGRASSDRRSSNGMDTSFMTPEDLLYQMQQEIADCIAQSESSAVDTSKQFLWSGHMKRLLSGAIEKLKYRDQLETNGYSASPDSEFLDMLNRIFLPLWPEGWMSSAELDEVIRQLTMTMMDRIEDEDEHEEAMADFGEEQDFGSEEGLGNYSDALNDHAIDTAYSSGGESPLTPVIENQPSHYQGNNENGAEPTIGGGAVCFICDRSFQSTHLLKIHVSHMHTPKELVCPHCQSRHSTVNGLRFHVSTKHKGLSQRFINDSIPSMPLVSMVSVPSAISGQQQSTSAYVGRTVGSYENPASTIGRANSAIRTQLPLQSTARLYNGSATRNSCEIECSSCKNKFGSVGALKAHVSLMHTEKNIRCRYCPNMYATQRAMLQHTYLKHHKERNCQCPQCGETFQTPGLANMHRRFAHNSMTGSASPVEKPSPQSLTSQNSGEQEATGMETGHSDEISTTIQSSMTRIRGNGKYHCRDCGAGFPMPSAVWAHRKKEHSDSTSIKKRGMFSLSDPQRAVGGQIFANDLVRQSKDTSNGKKKLMRVKCSACSAVFSNGYACYLHKKKIHGEESIRRELNLSERSSLASASATTLKLATSISQVETASIAAMPSHSSTSENFCSQLVTSGSVSQARMSTSSSSSRDSSPFYRGNDTLLPEGIVRRRYEFHCQCGMTFYNGFAFSRHRQRTGCSDGVRGVVVKESVCGICSEAFPSSELLNEHFNSTHGGGGVITSANATSKFISTSSSTPVAISGEVEEGIRTNTEISSSSGYATAVDSQSSPGPSRLSTQRQGATATAYVTTTVLKRLPDGATSMASSNQQERATAVSDLTSDIGAAETSFPFDRFPLRCLLCPYEALSIDALDEHRRRHEKTSVSISIGPSGLGSCPYCSYVTDSISNYVRHAAIHLSDKGSNLGLMAGIKRISEVSAILDPKKKQRRLECIYCGRRFIDGSELMEHEFMHGTGK